MLQVCPSQNSKLIMKHNVPQEHDGSLNFATDAWTSPNHRAYIGVMVHFEVKGEKVAMLLDLIEVAESHTGVALATAFAKILHDFSISSKVSVLFEIQFGT